MITQTDKTPPSLGRRISHMWPLKLKHSPKSRSAKPVGECAGWTLPLDIFREIANHSSDTEVWCLSKCSKELRALLLPEIYAEVLLKCGTRKCSTILDMLSNSPHLWIHIRTLALGPDWLSYPIEPLVEGWIISKVEKMIPGLARLHKFHWCGILSLPESTLAALRHSCPELRNLAYGTEMQMLSPGSELFKFRNLFQLSIFVRGLGGARATSSTSTDFPPQLCEMLLGNPDLEQLVIDAPGKRLDQMSQLLHGQWPKLWYLNIALFSFPVSAQRQLPTFLALHPSLTTLGLCFDAGDTILPLILDHMALPLLTSFTGVSQHFCALPSTHLLAGLALHNIIDTAESLAPTLAALPRFPFLNHLEIQLVDAGHISKLRAVVSICPYLVTLNISYLACNMNQLKEVAAVLAQPVWLRSLKITKPYRLVDGSMLSAALLLLAHNHGLRDIHLICMTAKGWKQSGDYNVISTDNIEVLEAKEFGLRAVGGSFTRQFQYGLEGGPKLSKGLARMRL
ncbi:hypothetical protein C8F04DRAFT_1102817 [Mycena alexandri]|uniref:F-box domain-containing protein n=1 Tax=Mycena alexandri TaxID=1745969 RepID=A0AAD6STY9_9AGAR|nr:hypothetical protein C8F04DRAFT_1102817 [Mycena alexandri]